MYNILICDDQPDIVNALKIYLSMGDYRLFEAYTGRQAVELVQKEEIHLILMDIMMPEMDGIAATQRIREFSNAPIILLTAKSENEDKVLGLNVGADDYITKPFVPMEVLARVRSQLRRYTLLGGQAPEKPSVQDRHRGRRTCQSHPHGVFHFTVAHVQSREGLFLPVALRSGMERGAPEQRGSRGGTHPPPSGEN